MLADIHRSPVILTALAAVLAFIPLTQSIFRGSLAYTLIGGTAGGTALVLVFLPALYSIWYRVKPTAAKDNLVVPREEEAGVVGSSLVRLGTDRR